VILAFEDKLRGRSPTPRAGSGEEVSVVGKVAMEPGPECNWFLSILSDGTFALQYTGPDAGEHLPPGLTGIFKLSS
jgi:hypothetical protein